MSLGARCRIKAVAALIIFGGLLAPEGVSAQGLQLPGAVEPGRREPPRLDVPQAPAELEWSVQLPPGAEPPESLKAEKLTLNDLIIDGVTIYRREQLIDLFKPFLGKEITFGQFYGIARAIQRRYRKDGYILTFSYVPPQTVENGVFHIAVVEGFVERVIVADVEGRTKRTLERGLAPIVSARPLNVRTLERYLLLANDLAGVKVTGVLRPSRTTRGATVLEVKVRRKPISARATFDNRSSEFSGPLATSYNLSANNAAGTGERISLGLSEASLFTELTSITAGYQQPLGADGLRVNLAVEQSKTEPGFTLDQSNVKTSTFSFDADLSYPIIRSREENLSIGAGFTVRDTEVQTFGALLNRDRTRLARANLTYNKFGFLGGSSSAVLGLNQALPILDANDTDKDPGFTSRDDAHRYFSTATLDLAHVQPLGEGFELRLNATGQYARTATIASEEFAVGGAEFGRAYNSGEITGEDGVAFSVELNFNPRVKIPLIRRVLPYGFYDFGKAWDKSPGSSSELGRSLSSAGIGVQVATLFGMTFRLEYAYPLTKHPSNQTDGKQGRVFFFTGWSY